MTDGFEWGEWPSPVTSEVLADARISMSGLQAAPGQVWWSESRPADGGRQAVLGARTGAGEAGGPLTGVREVGPPAVSVRSRVHEYGGGAWVVAPDDDTLFFVDATDQAVWCLEGAGAPHRLSGLDEDEPCRHGDLGVAPGRPWVLAVRERHGRDGVENEIVAVPAAGDGPSCVLVGDRDFFAAPRADAEGRRLAWLTWDQPDMPWDASQLWVGVLSATPDGRGLQVTPDRCVAGGPGESVGQPTWSADGSLWFVSDRRGWWQPYRWRPGTDPPAAPVCEVAAEFHAPDWVLGQRTLVPLPDGTALTRVHRHGRDHLARLHPATGSLETIDQPCVTITAVAAVAGDRALTVALLGATPTEAQTVHVLETPPAPDATTGGRTRSGPVGTRRRLQPSSGPRLGPDEVSTPELLAFDTVDRARTHLLFYRPVPPSDVPVPASPPPLLVLCHGGPTGAAEPGLDFAVQFWTTRGIAVAAVDYRGSSGYGRDYRRLLDGRWGVADAEDVVGAARFLVERGRADGSRLAVRGASAGGLTALRAATPGGPFAAALVAYGVTDLEALARDTHKFEARYIDRLVGPWPEAAARYHERSPARHPERIGAAVLLLQGEDDAVVPPDQAARMATALRSRGLRCDHIVFPGEGHGFRRADTVVAAARAELRFLSEVLGFVPAPEEAGPRPVSPLAPPG